MPRLPEEMLEECKDIVDEISDLVAPLQTLDELIEYAQSVRKICEAPADDTELAPPAPTQP